MSAHNNLDGAALTIANCRFISPPDADFVVIVTREQQPLGQWPWTAHVVRTVDGSRSLFLCATGSTPETAVCELLAKSADAVRTYVKLNGYTLPPDLHHGEPSKGNDGCKESLSDSSATVDVLDNELSASSGCESLSDDETVSVLSGRGTLKTELKGGKGRKRKEGAKGSSSRLPRSRSRSTPHTASRSRSRSCSSSGSSGIVDHDVGATRTWAAPPQIPSNHVVRSTGTCNTLAPPGYTSCPSHMPGMPRTNRVPPPQPLVHSPFARAMDPSHGQSLFVHVVLLRIHWVGRGHAQVMQRLVANKASIGSAALAYVRRNADAFAGAQPSDHHALKMPLGSPGGLSLLATLRSVTLGGEHVDLRHYQGDNLGALLNQGGANDARACLPKFEIEVSVSNSPQPPPLPPPLTQYVHQVDKGFARPASVDQLVGDC